MTDTRARALDVIAHEVAETYGDYVSNTYGTRSHWLADADEILAALEAAGLVVEAAELVEKLLDACGEKDHHIATLEDMANNPPDLSAEDREQLARDVKSWDWYYEFLQDDDAASLVGYLIEHCHWHITRRTT